MLKNAIPGIQSLVQSFADLGPGADQQDTAGRLFALDGVMDGCGHDNTSLGRLRCRSKWPAKVVNHVPTTFP